MPLSECPVCHQKPAYAGNVAYCPHCGWNRSLAISSLQTSLNSTFVGILMFAGFAAFLYWGLKFNRTPALMIFPFIPALVIPLNYFFARKKLARLKAMPVSQQDKKFPRPSAVPSNFSTFADNASSEAPTFRPSSRDEALLHAPAPRQIRMSKTGRIAMSVAAVGLSIFVIPMAASLYNHWNLYHSFANVQGLGWMIAIEVIVALAAFGIWRTQVRECNLLRNGEVAMGRVVSQFTDQKRNSTVQYEFTDSYGASHRGGGQDLTSQLVTGSGVAVFYDRDNPKRNIPTCATYHEVVLPLEVSPSADPLLTRR
jgi:hypothetical protein